MDRFGPLPEEVQKLVDIVKLRWQAQQLGFEKLTIKKEVMKGYIPSENNDAYFQSDTFGNILKYVQQYPRRSRLKEAKHKLVVTVEDIRSIKDAKAVFEGLGVKETAPVQSP